MRERKRKFDGLEAFAEHYLMLLFGGVLVVALLWPDL